MHHQYTFTVPAQVIDENDHVNNVVYVQWMQEAATAHATAMGSVAALEPLGATWVVREHRIRYLKPAFEGDLIGVQTWVEGIRRVRSMRRYRFVRTTDLTVLAEGETDWIFMDIQTQKPRSVPPHIQEMFSFITDPKDVPIDTWH